MTHEHSVLAHGTHIKPINSRNDGILLQPLAGYGGPDDMLTSSTSKSSFSQEEISTVYPPNSFGIKKNLHKIHHASKISITSPIPMDLSQLTTNELKQLEAIHRKLFPAKSGNARKSLIEAAKTDFDPRSNPMPARETPYLTRMLPGSSNTLQPATSPPRIVEKYENYENLLNRESERMITTHTPPPLMVYEKPKFTTPKSLKGVNFGQGSQLTPDMITELSMLREIPDLEELTEGMDLSLLNKPGGFAVLKQQFIERLIQRKIHNEGTSQGAGGNFRNEPTLLNSQDSGFEQFRQHASIYDSIPSTFNSFKETSYRKAPTSLNGNVAGGQCPAIDCSFDDESICQYMTFTEFDDFDLIMGDASMKKLRHWDLSNRQISNSLTGIPKDVTGQGFFAFAGNSEDPEETFVLVTKQKVHVRNAAKLNFSVYMAGRKGRLRVCIENLQKCSFLKLGSEITVDARQWFKHYIQVPSGSYNIIFVADRLEKNYVIGLDQIFLQHEGGGSDLCA